MRLLSVVHGENGRAELFAQVVAEAGHRLDEWSFVSSAPPQLPPASYDAVLVFGGAMNADQEDVHPWLRDEGEWLRGLLDRSVPTLGVCLGSQLIAQAAGASVGPLPEPEIGFSAVELTAAGAADPVLSALPRRFDAFEWHHYASDLPEGATELARSAASLQAFRYGEACWGVQFHPEVTAPQLDVWLGDKDDLPPEPERLRAEIRERLAGWNALGRRLCLAFLAAAERAAG